LIARVFKWVTLALFAYIGAVLFAKPYLADVLRGTLILIAANITCVHRTDA